MTAPIPPNGLTVEKSALATQIKAQARIAMAALAGLLLGRMVDRGWLPAALNTGGTAEVIVAVANCAVLGGLAVVAGAASACPAMGAGLEQPGA